MIPLFPPDNPEALLHCLRVGWLGEFLRHYEQALAAGLLLLTDREEVEQMLRECWRLHATLQELFPDPILAEGSIDVPLILHGGKAIAIDEIPF